MSQQASYKFGAFSLDLKTRRLFRNGKHIPLNPKEFDVLLVLVQRNGEIVEREELLNAVWPDIYVGDAVLSQNIYTIRKALTQEDDTEYIETVPKRGYLFKAGDAEEKEPDRLTFQHGVVTSARFDPHSREIIYSAAWNGRPAEIFSMKRGSRVPRSLGLVDAHLFGISHLKEIAFSLTRRFVQGYVYDGDLVRVSLDGGSISPISNHIQWADWSPDGYELAVVREVEGMSTLEFPIGRVIYKTGGWISHPRVSRQGKIAFLDHPIPADDSGDVVVIENDGEKKTLSSEWMSIQGLAWSATGDEIWFTAAKAGNARAIYGVTLEGRQRLIKKSRTSLTLHDVSEDGDVLVTYDDLRLGIVGRAPGANHECNLSRFDWSLARDLSSDGKKLLFTEAGEAGGTKYGVYLREMNDQDGSSVKCLGDGSALAFSPNGEWALAKLPPPSAQLVLLPTETGKPVKPKFLNKAEHTEINYQQWASWFPDNKRILFTGNEPGHGTKLYVQDIEEGEPYSITPDEEGIYLSTPHAISPCLSEECLIAAIGPDQRIRLYSEDGKQYTELAGSAPGDMPIRWANERDELYVRKRGQVPVEISKVNIKTGHREMWKKLMPPTPTEDTEILRVLLTPDGESYAYTYTRDSSDLWLIEGLGGH